MAALRTHLLCISCTVWMILTSLPGRHAMNSGVPDGFVYTDLYITARKGDELVLKCQFYGTPIAVYWKKGNDPTRSPNLITRVEGEPSSGSCVADQFCSMDDDYSLIINSIKVADQGTYICRVSNYQGILIHNFTEVAVYDHISKSTNLLQSVKVLCELPDQLNVVKCVGFCQEQSSTIYEFIFGGTLLTYLQTTGVQSQPTYSNLKPNRVCIDESSLLNFAWQIAKGMQFLASKKIIHGTLCAHNVLLGDRKQCKLSDYGLASSVFSNRGKPSRWSSPETMVTGVQSTEGDIWSFGIVLWEIVTLGARPYPDMTYDTVQKEVSNGYKMGRPRHCGQELYAIMSRCWETDGQNRIKFDEILKTLERILEKTHDYLSLSDLDKDLYASLSDSEKDLYESPLDV